MSDDKSIDPRTQVLLSLLPPGAVFRHCYSDDSLWRPDNRGYVNERDPLRAGLYQPDGYYAPWAPTDKRLNDHSFTIDAAEYLRKYTAQDGTTLALLIDEVLQLRARADMATRQITDATIRLARALGYSDEDDLPPEGLDDLLVEVAWYVDAAESETNATSAAWCASINPGRHASDCEDDDG